IFVCGMPLPAAAGATRISDSIFWRVLVIVITRPRLKRNDILSILTHRRAMQTALDLKEDILRLKKERNAIILAHNYQIGPIQDLADYVGDSLGLAYQAQKTNADVIAFCGVHFMAETAKILNPDKTVVLPDRDAGCSLEQACPADKLAA